MHRRVLVTCLAISCAVGLMAQAPTALYRGTDNAIWISQLSSPTPISSGGIFASAPASAQDSSGNTYAAAIDSSGGLWANFFSATSHTWDGWFRLGGVFVGSPTIAANSVGALIYARDSSGQLWSNLYAPPSTANIFRAQGGVFASDPILAVIPPAAQPISFFLTAVDSSGGVWSGYRDGNASLFTWRFAGGIVSNNKFASTVGSDGNEYTAIVDASGAIWMQQETSSGVGTWFNGGGVFTSGVSVASLSGKIAVAASDASGAVWVAQFTNGSTNGWGSWSRIGGISLQNPQIAEASTQYAVAATGSGLPLWWYDANTPGWSSTSLSVHPQGNLSAAPR